MGPASVSTPLPSRSKHVYMVQILVLFVLLLVLKNATFFAPKVFASTIIACALTWILTAAASTWRSKVPYVDPEAHP